MGGVYVNIIDLGVKSVKIEIILHVGTGYLL